MDWVKQEFSMDWEKGEYGLGKARVWTVKREYGLVKQEYGLGKARVWTG